MMSADKFKIVLQVNQSNHDLCDFLAPSDL
jgi:hypothetical protein